MKKRHLLTLPLLAAAAPLAAAASAAPATLEPIASATLQESEFGEPVFVNGVRISDMAIKRFLVYGPGRNGLDARKLQILMDHERALRLTEERDAILAEMPDADEAAVGAELEKRMKRYDVDQDAIKRRLDKEKAGFTERYPTLDHEVELRRAYGSGDWYRDQVRQTMEFDQLFFPDHPDTWPELASEAIYAGSPQVDLIADYASEYERRLKVSLETGEPIQPEQEMMMSLLRDFVMQALWSLAEVKTATQGIPEELAMVIDGGDWRAEIKTQDVYDEMRVAFAPQDIEDAKLFLALMESARQKLAAADAVMDESEFVAMVADIRSQMQNTMFNMDFLALQGHGFPSPEAYELHLMLVESYKRMNESKLQPGDDGSLSPELKAHLPVANGIMGLAKSHADILLVSAFDFPNFEWKADGWQWAYERANALRTQVDEHLALLDVDRKKRGEASERGENYVPETGLLPFDRWWAEFLQQNSEYWDPPLPVTGKQPPAIGLKNFGAFQDEPMTRNDMKRAIGESEYEHFLSNGAIVDTIFFDMEPGTVGGPFRGPKGYYIVYLKSRSAPTNPLNTRTERHMQMIQEDWIRKSFQAYCHDALMGATVSGL
ncbi:MAG: peptidylprolyl isomerase [Planctomycetota bacterium]